MEVIVITATIVTAKGLTVTIIYCSGRDSEIHYSFGVDGDGDDESVPRRRF